MLKNKKSYCNTIFPAWLTIFLSTSLFSQQDTLKSYFQPLQDVFQTDLVYPQEKNEVQLSIVPEFQRSGDYDHLQFLFMAEYGLTDMWQIEFGWNLFQKRFIEFEPSVSGTGDIEIGTQYSFMNIANTDFHTAISFEVSIPLGNEDKGLGEGLWEYEPCFLVALDLPSLNNTQFFTQVGIGLVRNESKDKSGNEESESHEIHLNCGIFVPFGKVIFTTELNLQSDKWNGGDENQLYLTPGFVFNLPVDWETGVGMPVGLNKQSDKFRIMAILTYEFNLAKDND